MNILICLNNNPTPELLDAILVALAQGGVEYIASDAGGVTVISPANHPAQPTDTVPDVVNVPAEPVDLPQDHQFKVDLPADAPELEVSLSTGAMEVPVEEPTVNPAPTPLPNVIIKSFSLTAQVKAIYDPSSSFSYIKVLNVGRIGNIVTFTYGGIEYKYPCSDDGIILVTLSFTDKQHEQFPCPLKVEQLGDEIEELVFGTNEHSIVQSYIA